MIQLDVNEAKKVKPSGRILRAPYYDHLSDHPSDNLTPSKIRTLLRKAEDGDITAQSELYEDILDKDPTIFAALDTRKGAVLTLPWEIMPAPGLEDKRSAKKQIDRITSALDRMSVATIALNPGFAAEYLTFQDLLAYLLDATGRGFVGSQLIWDKKTYEPVAAKQFAQKHFIVGDLAKRGGPDFNPYEILVRTEEKTAYGEKMKPYEFVFHFSRDKAGLPSRLGILRTLVYWYLFKNFGIKSFVRAAERYGTPLVYGQYDMGASQDDIDTLEEAVQNLGIDAGAVFSRASDITILDTSSARNSGELYTALVHLVNQEISKAVLGHASTTESTPGKLGAEDQAMGVQTYRIERDARALEDSVNTYLVEPMGMFVEGQVLCHFKLRYEAEEDVNARADRIVKLVSGGIEVPKAYTYEALDIPAPSDDEPVFSGGGMQQFFNKRTVVRNVAPKTKSARHTRKQRAISSTERLASDSANELANAYAILTRNLDADESAIDIVRERKAEFIEAFEPVMRKVLETAMQISGTELGIGNVLKPEPITNKIDPFKVRNINALSWLEWHALTLTQIEGEQITLSLAKRIKDALVSYEAGLTPKEFFDRVLDSEGIGKIGRGHLNTVLRTNVSTARAAATEIVVDRNADMFPMWEYVAVIDDRTRDDHADLDGMMFDRDDRKYYPPIGFNCRCEASFVTAVEAEEAGYDVVTSAAQDVEVPTGFGSDARVNYARWVDKERRENPEIADRLSPIITEVSK